jgi:hypothetical protein
MRQRLYRLAPKAARQGLQSQTLLFAAGSAHARPFYHKPCLLTASPASGKPMQHERDATTPETGRDQTTTTTAPRALAGADQRQAKTTAHAKTRLTAFPKSAHAGPGDYMTDDARDRAIAVAEQIRARVDANGQRAKLTPAQRKLLDLSAKIFDEPATRQDAAYLPRELVQVTLPHKNPGNVPVWTRTNGNLTIGIQPGMNLITRETYGYPYGTVPRLLPLLGDDRSSTHEKPPP